MYAQRSVLGLCLPECGIDKVRGSRPSFTKCQQKPVGRTAQPRDRSLVDGPLDIDGLEDRIGTKRRPSGRALGASCDIGPTIGRRSRPLIDELGQEDHLGSGCVQRSQSPRQTRRSFEATVLELDTCQHEHRGGIGGRDKRFHQPTCFCSLSSCSKDRSAIRYFGLAGSSEEEQHSQVRQRPSRLRLRRGAPASPKRR